MQHGKYYNRSDQINVMPGGEWYLMSPIGLEIAPLSSFCLSLDHSTERFPVSDDDLEATDSYSLQCAWCPFPPTVWRLKMASTLERPEAM
jgi:hypothetical protein